MPSCFVPGCNTGYSSLIKWNKANGIKNPSMFKAPSNDVLLEMWQQAVPRTNKLLTKNDKICELHFNEEEIEREYTTKMPDGTVFTLKKGTPNLKPDAVPSIFPNSPKCSTRNHPPKHKDPMVRTEIPKIPCEGKKVVETAERMEVTQKACPELILLEVKEEAEEAAELGQCMDEAPSERTYFDVIAENLALLKLPSEYWFSCTLIDNMGMNNLGFTCWSNDLSRISKRLVLAYDMTFKMYVNEKPIFLPGENNIINSEELEYFLEYMNKLQPCLTTEGCDQCLHYVLPKRAKTGPPATRCVPCQKYRQYLKRKNSTSKSEDDKLKTINNKLRNTRRQNYRLQSKVQKLKLKLQMKQCSKIKVSALGDEMKLPEAQQSAIKHFHSFPYINVRIFCIYSYFQK